MKVENEKPEFFYTLGCIYILGYIVEIIIKNLAIKKKSSTSGEFGSFGFFLEKKILCIGRNHIFQVEIWRNHTPSPEQQVTN
jgi:hypothetical protein